MGGIAVGRQNRLTRGPVRLATAMVAVAFIGALSASTALAADPSPDPAATPPPAPAPAPPPAPAPAPPPPLRPLPHSASASACAGSRASASPGAGSRTSAGSRASPSPSTATKPTGSSKSKPEAKPSQSVLPGGAHTAPAAKPKPKPEPIQALMRHAMPASAVVVPVATVSPAITSTTAAQGSQTLMFVLVALSVGFVLVALVPEQVGVHGSFARRVVEARFVFAAAGLSLLVGLAVPLLAGVLQ